MLQKWVLYPEGIKLKPIETTSSVRKRDEGRQAKANIEATDMAKSSRN